MRLILSIGLAAALIVLAVLAMLVLARGLRRAMTATKADHIPIPVINPPAPVVHTGWVEVVGWVTIVWALMHPVLIILAVLGRVVIFTVPITAMVMIFVLVASLIAGAGGLMLLKLMPNGRSMISWGLLLLGILAFLGCTLALVLRTYEDAPLISRELAVPVAIVLGLHTLTDAAIGTAAQRVGGGGRSDRLSEEQDQDF